MASSTASPSGYSRRRQNPRRQPIARSNSLFGAIKNIVTAPLSWFASTDDFEDTRDNMGKRRRLKAAPTEPALGEDERGFRSKRMRVDSPPRERQREGYLDPPSTVLQQSQSLARSVSAGIPHRVVSITGDNGSYIRSTISPFRNLSISRTMSVDPPPRPQSRDGGTFQSQRPLLAPHDFDASMEALPPLPPLSASPTASFPRSSLSVPRDLSLPYSRPPFRMRTSLTPQPSQIQRERSEPPPLQSLMTNPTFVRPPPVSEEAPRAASSEPTATLGSLVESVRRVRSPRQPGSLLFGSKSQTDLRPAGMSPAEKALHELEIYKTPLLPTRLRTGNLQSSITGVPDLFKSRRTSRLVLMKDEKRASDRKLGRKEAGSPDRNVTKPYAGEGGMKKLLAKRKSELEGEDQDGVGRAAKEKPEKENGSEGEKGESLPPILPAEVARVPEQDWYSLASGSSGNASGSALRVGRAKSSRNHISRPTSRSRSKFSAAFEDDVDDAMLEQDKEKELLEEAAKNAPVFNIPTGFSFDKDVKPIEHNRADAKEPPISSLPFSLSAAIASSTTPPSLSEAEKNDISITASSTIPPPSSVGPPPAAQQERSAPLFGPPPTIQQPAAGAPSSNEGIPNFFARSAAFNKPLEIKTPPLNFSLKTAEPVKPDASAAPPIFSFSATPSSISTPSADSGVSSLFGSPAPSAPVKDTANPLWDGEKKTAQEGGLSRESNKVKPEAPISVFGAAKQEKEALPQVAASTEAKVDAVPVLSSFRDPANAPSAPASSGFSLTSSNIAPDSSTKPSFSFGNLSSAPTTSLFGSKPTIDSGPAIQNTPSLFGIQASTTSTTAFSQDSKGSPFGGSPNIDTTRPTTSLFGGTAVKASTETEKPSLFVVTTPAPSTTSFSFGQQATSSTQFEIPKPEASKPVATNTFSFTPSMNDAKPANPAQFTFGSPDKKAKPDSPAPFPFGAPNTPAPTEKMAPSFSFGTPSSSPVPPSSSIFSFGAGGSTAGDVSKPLPVDRPVTPPKNSDQEFQMEESPTREIQQNNGNNKPAFGGFSFGNPPTTGSVLFGGPLSAPSTTAPFPFGSTPSPNPFAPQPIKETKSEEPKSFTFGQTGMSSGNTGFPFAQNQGSETRPSTAGSFNFGSTPTATTSGFNFGAPPASNPFGQAGSGSAPSSPSTFQSSTFNFGAPSGGPTFSFGSQPASPAGSSTALPQATTPVAFGSGSTGFGSSAPSSPFNAPAQIAPSTSSGGTLFTIGAPPPPQGTNAQGRAIRKLPTRNRAKR